MLATKNITWRGAIVFLALAIFLAGCGPPGPRALLKGRKLLDRGDYSERGGAIENRDVVDGHQRAGVELSRRRVSARRSVPPMPRWRINAP